MASTERFGYEWDTYHFMDPRYEFQFRNWIAPLTESDFKDAEILDAGCGMGRNSYWPLTWGAKRLVALDFDTRSVARARATLAKFPQAEVKYCSVYDIEFDAVFDVVFCIGVLHHLEKPEEAIQKLYRAVKPGGKLVFWVYGYEGNEWIVKWVDPIRKSITSRFPLSILHYLSYLCSIPLTLRVRMISTKNPYLQQLASFDFWHIHSIVFDQLIPSIANYWSLDNLNELFRVYNDKKIVQPLNKCGWTVLINRT